MTILLYFELKEWEFWGDVLGPQYLAAELRSNGYEVEILGIPEEINEEFINDLIRANPALIGFSLPCPFYKRFSMLGEILKKNLKKTHITCGNRYASDNSELLLEKYEWLDSVIRGEGEYTIVDMAKRLEQGLSLKDCEGIYYKSNGIIIKNQDRPFIEDLSKMQFPVRDILLKYPKDKNVTFLTSRGCVNHCTFCNSSYDVKNKGRVWRGRTTEHVVNELEYISKELGYKNFFFVDPSYEEPGTMGKNRIREIAEEILKRKIEINYGVYFSAHRWSEEDLPLLKLLQESGLEYIYVGVEAGTSNSLEFFKKKATVEDNIRMINLVRTAGIGLKFGYIMFHPYMTLGEVKDNIEFLRKTKLGYSYRCFNNELEVYNGTVVYDVLERDELLTGETDLEMGTYLWEYKDEKVKLLRDITKNILEDNTYIQSGIALEYKVISFIHRMKNNSKRYKIHELEVYNWEKEIDIIFESMSEVNCQFFSNVVDFLKKEDFEGFEEMKKCYVEQISKLVKHLESLVFTISFKAAKLKLLK